LIGKKESQNGIYVTEINSNDMKKVFADLRIQCVKKGDIEEALNMREQLQVDPFKSKFRSQ